MKNNLIEFNDYTPHFTLQTIDKNVHVFPVALVEDWVFGKQKIQDADDWEMIIRSILLEWLKQSYGWDSEKEKRIIRENKTNQELLWEKQMEDV